MKRLLFTAALTLAAHPVAALTPQRCLVQTPEGDCTCQVNRVTLAPGLWFWSSQIGPGCQWSVGGSSPRVIDPAAPPPAPPRTGCDGGHDRNCDGIGGDRLEGGE